MKIIFYTLLSGLFLFLVTGCDEATEPKDEQTPEYLPGIQASYSTGSKTVESIIYHGYWSTCTGTGNNLYEGQCTAVDDSPVNWAWGNFSATWEGYIYIPESGNYIFNSHYWVDGIIYIAINDSVVADLNTPGGGYSKTLTLTGKTWYPLSMTFTSNGGSNNMHLGWIKPGAEWEIMPAENLGHLE